MPSRGNKLTAVSLSAALVITLTLLSLTPAQAQGQCPTLSAEGSFPGTTEFNTVKSQMWLNDGLWWGVFSDDNLGLFFYTFHNGTAAKGPLVDSNVNGKPDVLWDGNNLFVMIWKSVSLAALYKYNYDPVTRKHALISGFPVNLPLIGGSSEALVIEKDSTGKLWATYTGTQGPLSDGKVRVIWSTSADHKAWNTSGAELESGLQANQSEISAIIHFDNNKIGIAWSNRPAKEIAFRFHADGQPETSWSPKEIIDSGLGPRGLGEVADDHLSIKAAPDGRVFLVAKDNDHDGIPANANAGSLWLYIRTAAGSWGSKTIVQPDLSRGSTRPVLLLDAANDRAFVIYHDDSPSGNGLNFITNSSMTNPAFSVPCPFSLTPANNLTSTKQNVSSNTGFLVAAHGGPTGNHQVLFRTVGMTLTGAGFVCDVAPRPEGNGSVSVADWVLIGRFASGLITPEGSEFQRADANRDGAITISDWVKCGRVASGLDPLTPNRPVPEH
jgi:hypothetical protein